MTYDLIPAEDVTGKRLMNLFKAAYFDVKHVESSGDLEVLELLIGQSSMLLFVDSDKIEITAFLNLNLHETCGEKLLLKVLDINSEYLAKFAIRKVDGNPNYNFRVVVEHCIRFTRGLNPHQLIDDIRIVYEMKRVMFREFIEFVQENNFLRD